MIWDSNTWKRDLARRSKALLRRRSQKRWREDSRAAVERDVFVIAYSIRKLLDARKLSDEVESMTLPVLEYASRGKPIDFMNWDKIEDLFEMSDPSHSQWGLRALCNQFVHSQVFMTALGDHGGLEGLFVTSERDRNKRLLFVQIDDYIGAIEEVAEDDIVSMSTRRDATTGEMRILRKSRMPPAT